jgi:hypothetical protein
VRLACWTFWWSWLVMVGFVVDVVVWEIEVWDH